MAIELVGNVKNYDWGNVGRSSLVATLALANDSERFIIDEDCPYAEIWFGDHVSGSATLKISRQSFREAVESDPGMIGMPSGPLPFLVKVLSIRKALSVQLHPDEFEAPKLHAQFPDIYKDSNHKPELAIALTPFEALCGFRPYDEIAKLVTESQELGTLLGDDILQKFAAKETTAVKAAFERLMRSEQTAIEQCVKSIAERQSAPSDLRSLFQRLYDDFGADVGVLSIYFLNYLELSPGKAIFLAANVPHAYLKGDCLECMACSDNVVRVGLTPKFKDVDTLLRLVSYRCAPSCDMLLEPDLPSANKYYPHVRVFDPPVRDFTVTEINLPESVRCYEFENPVNGSMLVMITGNGQLIRPSDTPINLKFGTVCFLPSGHERKTRIDITGASVNFHAFLISHNCVP